MYYIIAYAHKYMVDTFLQIKSEVVMKMQLLIANAWVVSCNRIIGYWHNWSPCCLLSNETYFNLGLEKWAMHIFLWINPVRCVVIVCCCLDPKWVVWFYEKDCKIICETNINGISTLSVIMHLTVRFSIFAFQNQEVNEEIDELDLYNEETFGSGAVGNAL